MSIIGLVRQGPHTIPITTSLSRAPNLTADMRATTASTSPQYGITFGTSKTLYFDGVGQFTTSLDANSRYQVSISFPSSPPSLSYADVKITWPAAATPANASGSVEMFA